MNKDCARQLSIHLDSLCLDCDSSDGFIHHFKEFAMHCIYHKCRPWIVNVIYYIIKCQIMLQPVSEWMLYHQSSRINVFHHAMPANNTIGVHVFVCNVNIWNAKCAWATALIFDSGTDVLEEVWKFLRKKTSCPNVWLKPQTSDSCRMLYQLSLLGETFATPFF